MFNDAKDCYHIFTTENVHLGIKTSHDNHEESTIISIPTNLNTSTH